MTTKRLFALLVAVLMLVTLFSACADDSGNDDANQPADSGNASDAGSTGGSGNDEPTESEPYRLTYMGCETHQWTHTLDEAEAAGFESLANYNELMLEKQNLVVEPEVIDNESYKTTLSGYLAANALLDAFLIEGSYMDADVMVNSVNSGRFANINDILPYSDGNFANLVSDDGEARYVKAWSTAPDGEWYYVKNADGGATALNLDNDEVDYINDWPIGTFYVLNIRQDWLDKCGLSMPITIEEFKEALIQFQEQDANGNGAKDERAFLGFGTSDVFVDGLAAWFGLPRANFAMSPVDGALENAVEGEGYIDFVNYANELYTAQVALLSEGGRWKYGANAAGNYCAAQCMYPDRMMTVSTGDPNSEYEPLPIIQAVEGIKPRILGQSSNAANSALAFNVDANYEAAAAYLDWLYSEDFYIATNYGIEGKAWEYDEEGNPVSYRVGTDLTQEEMDSYGSMWNYAPWALFPQIGSAFLFAHNRAVYDSVQEALDAGEPYRTDSLTIDEWKEVNAQYNWTDISPLNRLLVNINEYGEDNILFNLNINMTPLATNEESEAISMYKTDLTTYLDEMTTSYITGAKSTDTYEEDLQYAYDNLGMQEYMDAIQGQIDRYLVAMGRDAILAQ